jgi:DNA polymerase-3 subunit alpha
MAALISSVIDNPTKVSEYILSCRSMGIKLLAPDINEGEADFTVSDGHIRYSLTAIKNVGRPIIDSIVDERNHNGKYTSLQNFLERMAAKEENTVNKRAVENFIKAGCFDSLGGNRRQYIQVYQFIMDRVAKDKKGSIEGQMSIFDFGGEDTRKQFEVTLPPVEDFEPELRLAYEKEVLGIYVSGHPLEAYEELWRKKITNIGSDFYRDADTDQCVVEDEANVTIGGIIVEKSVKFTKNDRQMAFVQVEDLAGVVEVIVFARQYERYGKMLEVDEKIFVSGHVSEEENKNAKVIADKIWKFSDSSKTLWIKYANRDEYEEKSPAVGNILDVSDGKDTVKIYLEEEKLLKTLPANHSVNANEELMNEIEEVLGEGRVKVTW